ncbi:type IV toxin-antitoxin system AbiEi family antitoxin domain-containing protein [Nocardioides sp. Soil805]|uniref:type IV toxin-antitoxin system AbiEi family antitoxin domain-containing protein n=1 Tax=Nocardioides sp. Soil805 TaxID=1736416 RepID=UPI000702EBB8|nr:type IV toxin-antitoxin system AbiEi family antitoxin domain-containing protein [Nocardioides sp. Soil805]KRF35025.1 hypothetical protein ASG94_12905 [Nocardioides sp. Soil805]
MSDLDDLLARQSGVVSRAQLIALGASRAERDTLVRRRLLVPVLPGVYVDHTGVPTRVQRSIAAVLYAGRAALHLESALDHPGGTGVIHVAIDATRRVAAQPGIRIHRVAGLEGKVRWNLVPPRVLPEVAALERAHRAATDLDAIAAVAAVVGSRATTAERLGRVLGSRPRIRRRTLLADLLDDLAAGTHSVLEHGFLTTVVRPHALPEPSARQAPRVGAKGIEYRDAEYAELGVVVEMDSRWHDTERAADRDADRDLDDLAGGQVTVRLRYRQVFGTPCHTAARLGLLLRRRGWNGSSTACSPSCAVPAWTI